jgi:ankyrin repeat protein
MAARLHQQSDSAHSFVASLEDAAIVANKRATALRLRYMVQRLCTAIERRSPLDEVNRILEELEDDACLSIPGTSDETPLHVSGKTAQILVVDLLLDHGANPGIVNGAGETALFSAWSAAALSGPGSTSNGFQCAVSMLRHRDAPTFVNTRSAKGQTILMKACYASDEDFVQLLLRSGADPGVANNRGNTAVDIAKATGASDAVRRLLETASGTRVCD